MKLLRFESHKIMLLAFCEKGPCLNLKKYCIINGLICMFRFRADQRCVFVGAVWRVLLPNRFRLLDAAVALSRLL